MMSGMDANNGGALGPDGNGSDSNVVTFATAFEFVVYCCCMSGKVHPSVRVEEVVCGRANVDDSPPHVHSTVAGT